jgi:uncharacterized protein (TIRG00374 family)
MENNLPPESEKNSFFDPERPLAHFGRKIFISVLILALVIIYYVTRYSKGEQIIHTLIQINPFYLLLMLITESLYLVFQGLFFQRIYTIVGATKKLWYTLNMYLGMNLVNTIAPVIGISGSIYMMYFEKNNNLKRSDTLLINFLYYLTDYLVFLAILVLVLIYLILVEQITRTVLITSLIFTLFVIIVLVIALTIFLQQEILHRLVGFLKKILHLSVERQNPLDKVEGFLDQTRVSWLNSLDARANLSQASISAFGLHISCIFMLYLSFLAIHLPVAFQILISGYTIGTLLNIVSITPGGIGFAEAGMTAIFAAYGVPVAQALVVTLIYRTFFILYPLALGLVSINILPALARKFENISV